MTRPVELGVLLLTLALFQFLSIFGGSDTETEEEENNNEPQQQAQQQQQPTLDQTDIQSLRNQIEDLEASINEVKSQVERVNANNETLEDELETLDDRTRELSDLYQQLEEIRNPMNYNDDEIEAQLPTEDELNEMIHEHITDRLPSDEDIHEQIKESIADPSDEMINELIEEKIDEMIDAEDVQVTEQTEYVKEESSDTKTTSEYRYSYSVYNSNVERDQLSEEEHIRDICFLISASSRDSEEIVWELYDDNIISSRLRDTLLESVREFDYGQSARVDDTETRIYERLVSHLNNA